MAICRNCGARTRGFPLCDRCYWWRRHYAAVRLADVGGMGYALRRLKALKEWPDVAHRRRSGQQPYATLWRRTGGL